MDAAAAVPSADSEDAARETPTGSQVSGLRRGLDERSWRLILAILSAALLFTLWLRWEPATFGQAHDDSLYFSSAKALAEGQGNVLPSLPLQPQPSKYPILYPALLSLVWRLDPGFPENLAGGFWIGAFFACGFLWASAIVLRQLGASRWESLAIAAISSFHPNSFLLSQLMLSDMPFAALALGACALAGRAFNESPRSGRSRVLWTLVAALLWATTLTRTMGVAVTAGVVAAAILRKRFGAAAWCSVAALPVVFSLLGALLAGGAAEAAPDGLRQTLTFYTNYAGFWRMTTPDWEAFTAQALFNLTELLKHPAGLCFLLPAAGRTGGLVQAVAIALSCGVFKGVFEAASKRPAYPLHFMLLACAPIVVAWNYTLMLRFLLPFTPLLYFGAWREMKALGGVCIEKLRGRAPAAEKAIAAVMGIGIAILAGYGVREMVWRSYPSLARASAARSSHLLPRLEAYRWIREQTDQGDRFISYDDVELYLYTGRQGMRPMAFSTAAFYLQDEKILDRDLERLDDVARGVSANYWVVTDRDYDLETADIQLREATRDLTEGLAVVFESQDRSVRIVDLGPWLSTTK